MATIERDELQEALAARKPMRVVMVLGEQRFAQAHIPGSEPAASVEDALARLRPDEDIVVYCSGVHCSASARATRVLAHHGYTRVRRYVGGLEDWAAAGLPLASNEPDVEVAA